MEHPTGDTAARPASAPTKVSNPRWRPFTEGRAVLLPLVVLALAAALMFPPAILLVFLAAGAIVLAFRDPERDITPRPDVALAPADGRVISVGRVWDPYWQVELIEIAIFLSLADVHIQRSPLNGEVVAQHRRAGGYRPAMGRAATHGNNQLATYIHTSAGPCVVTQISGLVARRIVSWVGPGVHLAQGERLGMIKFGSQVTLRLPATAIVLVDVGDRVQTGLTPVAEVEPEVLLRSSSLREALELR